MIEQKDSLADRMKGYEATTRHILERGVPIVIRVDGKAFHTYLKHVPSFTTAVNEAMDEVAKALCEKIQGAQIAYVQSDEVSVFVHGYKNENSSAWFDNQLQKMCSVSASIASSIFTMNSYKIFLPAGSNLPAAGFMSPAFFDARVFTLPEHEVCNYFIWRQQDAIRNSVQSLARLLFSHKQVNGKNQIQMKEMCAQKGRAWEDMPADLQRGRAVYRVVDTPKPGSSVVRSYWIVDKNIPVFTQKREFIDRHLKKNEEADGETATRT